LNNKDKRAQIIIKKFKKLPKNKTAPDMGYLDIKKGISL